MRVRIADVLRHRPGGRADQLGGVRGRLGVDVRGQHGVAARSQEAGDLAAHAATGSGDDRYVHGAGA